MQMDKIYAGAEVTIVAAAGEDEDFGLPGISSRRSKAPGIVDFGSAQIFPFSYEDHSECGRSKWNTRGWTLQEGFLSRRTLIFTPFQAVFECRGCSLPESMYLRESRTTEADGIVSRLYFGASSGAVSIDHSDDVYFRLLCSFSNRDLSHESDSFSAFAGIAAYFSRANPPTFNLYGVPVLLSDYQCLNTSLGRGLAWCHDRVQPENLKTKGAPFRRSAFPSWTWTGWCGRINFPSPISLKGLNLELKELELKDGTILPYEALVKDGKLEGFDTSGVRALYIDAMLLCSGPAVFCYSDGMIKVGGRSADLRMSKQMENALVLNNLLSGEFRCLALVLTYHVGSWKMMHFLLIRMVDGSYCRVGCVELLFSESYSWLRDWVLERSEVCSVRLI
jgi:hypothetical protein